MTAIPLNISNSHARRFLLAHQGLAPNSKSRGTSGVLALIARLGCIQFDPINIVGRNPDLVLRARIRGYQPVMLEELLYQKHILVEGMDKVWSIHHHADWPHFSRRRQKIQEHYLQGDSAPEKHAWQIVEAMRSSGRDSSHLPKSSESVIWDWGRPVGLDRAALDLLNKAGIVTITSRAGNHKTYDLVERVLPAEILSAADPHPDLPDYQRWHVLRRVGGLGLAQRNGVEFWLGILNLKAPERRSAIEALIERGEIVPVEVEGAEKFSFLMRGCDEDTLRKTARSSNATPRMSFLPPLDNLLWDRAVIRALFGFDYLWEIYKKPAQRKFGHYTLPVLYGDRFVARCELSFDRSNKVLSVPAWWWEKEITPDDLMRKAAQDALEDFSGYLGAVEINMTILGKI
jgi:uncharacterized protein YcaQ